MRRLFYTEDSIQNKISYFHLLVFLALLPFDRFFSTIALISFLVHSIINFRLSLIRLVNRDVFFLQSVFWVTVLASIYAISFSAAMNSVSKQLAILLFPLILSTTELDLVKYRSRLMMAFAITCTLTVCYLYFDAFRVMQYDDMPFSSLFSAAFVNHNFSLPIGMHATYLSAMLAISFIYLLKRILLGSRKNNRILQTVALVILLAGLIQLSSKSVLIALVMIINIGFPWHISNPQKKLRFMVTALVASLLVFTVIYSVDIYRTRYVSDFRNDLFKSTAGAKENWRRERWKVSFELIRRAPIAGQGSGSEIPLLKQKYFEKKMFSSYLNELNAHNQYLSFLINSGIIGLLVFLATLGWGYRKAIKRNDLLLLSFLVIITAIGFSEDLLDVNKGIFFYAFFFPFFIFSKKKVENSTSENQQATVAT
ncbi:MAG: O-antigen ligase family protein [Ferruginibacter sp.]